MKVYQNRCPRCVANKKCTCWIKGAIKLDNKEENVKVFEAFTDRVHKDVNNMMPLESAVKDAIQKVKAKFGNVEIVTELIPEEDCSKFHIETRWTLNVKVG